MIYHKHIWRVEYIARTGNGVAYRKTWVGAADNPDDALQGFHVWFEMYCVRHTILEIRRIVWDHDVELDV